MKLDDFEDCKPRFMDFDKASGSRFLNDVELKSYIASKLREFGERLELRIIQADGREWTKGWNDAAGILKSDIDKELKELE